MRTTFLLLKPITIQPFNDWRAWPLKVSHSGNFRYSTHSIYENCLLGKKLRCESLGAAANTAAGVIVSLMAEHPELLATHHNPRHPIKWYIVHHVRVNKLFQQWEGFRVVKVRAPMQNNEFVSGKNIIVLEYDRP